MLCVQLAAFTIVATALVACGCGSSKTATTRTTASVDTVPVPVSLATGKPLTRAQLIVRGDAICANTNLRTGTLSAKTGSESLRTLPQVVIYYRAEVQSLGKLVPPASMAHDWRQIVTDIQRYSEYTNTAVRYAKENNFGAARLHYKNAITLLEQWPAIAGRDGFKQCSKLQ